MIRLGVSFGVHCRLSGLFPYSLPIWKMITEDLFNLWTVAIIPTGTVLEEMIFS